MDNGVALTPDEVKGRNMWLVWTGGDDRFWDHLSNRHFGAFDLLKTISSHPALKIQPRQPLELSRPDQRALLRPGRPGPTRSVSACGWTSARADCPPDPFANAKKYPGVAIGARGKNLPVGSYYG